MDWQPVLQFWFEELSPQQWWDKDSELDRIIEDQFGSLHAAAKACELWQWREAAEGRLAEIIILDQFSRNIFRNQPLAFAQDGLALALAQEAVRCRADLDLPEIQRSFMYMPYMHSESLAIHDQGCQLFADLGISNNLDFAEQHRAIIKRFGRYPHRNEILGRECSPEELAFLEQPGSSF